MDRDSKYFSDSLKGGSHRFQNRASVVPSMKAKKKKGGGRRSHTTLEAPLLPKTIKPASFSKMARKLEEDNRPIDIERTKVQIVSNLAGINGSMKEFSEQIEQKFKRAFNSKSGKQYGMSEAQMKKYSSAATLRKDDYDAIQKEAQDYLKAYHKKHGN